MLNLPDLPPAAWIAIVAAVLLGGGIYLIRSFASLAKLESDDAFDETFEEAFGVTALNDPECRIPVTIRRTEVHQVLGREARLVNNGKKAGYLRHLIKLATDGGLEREAIAPAVLEAAEKP